MSMPEQIRKQSAAVQALFEQMNKDDDDKKSTPANNGDAPDDNNQGNEPPVQTPPPQENFEQKYKTLQGMYNADTTRLRTELAELKGRLAVLEKQNPPPAPAAPTKPKREPTVLITDKDKEEFGDAIDVMRKAAIEEVENRYAETISSLQDTIRVLQGQISSEIVPHVKRVAQHQAASAEDQFWLYLDTNVPEWEAINASDAFQTWLLQKDKLSGLSRQAFLEDAQNKLDAVRVAEFFNEWKALNKPSNDPKPGANKSELEKQISPGKSKSGGTLHSQKDTVYTREDVRKFYRDVASGVYRGNDQERARIEADIFEAQRSGRIVDR